MIRQSLSIALLAGALVLPAAVSANVFDSVNQGLSSVSGAATAAQNLTSGQGLTSGAALLQQLGTGSFKLGSAENVAGILGYCQKQGYAPSAAETVKDKLLGTLGVQSQAEQSPAYQNGLTGVLQDAQGGTFDLSKLKGVVGKRACKAVTDQAVSSFLGK